MAKPIFSEKGIPMGRSKKTAVNKSARWSKEEDNYLKIALKDGIPVATVASKLGRTKVSIWNRKITLGLEGRFSRAKKDKGARGSKATKSPINIRPLAPTTQFELFKLEKDVPLPPKGGRNEVARDRIRQTFNKMEKGQSFVIPGDLVNTTRYLANQEFEAYKLTLVATDASKKFYRVYRLA